MPYPLIWLPASVTQKHSGVGKVMWVMQQLGRRAGALDVDLISNQPEGMTLAVFCSEVGCEKIWKMFGSRASKAVMISLLSTGNSLARGADSCCGCVELVCDVAAKLCVHLSALSYAVSLSVRFFSSPPS